MPIVVLSRHPEPSSRYIHSPTLNLLLLVTTKLLWISSSNYTCLRFLALTRARILVCPSYQLHIPSLVWRYENIYCCRGYVRFNVLFLLESTISKFFNNRGNKLQVKLKLDLSLIRILLTGLRVHVGQAT